LFADLSDVHTELHRALSQEHDDVTSLREGVEMVFEGLEEVFADEDVVCVKPEPGDEVDPRLHNIVTTRESEHESDTVTEVYKPGYEFDGIVLDPAQVVVSE
jgi:molecular chaperone GrpE